MRIVRNVVNIVGALIIGIITMYFSVSVCITLFLVFGVLDRNFSVPGEFTIPSLLALSCFQFVCIFIVSCLVFVRAKIGKKYDFQFLRPK